MSLNVGHCVFCGVNCVGHYAALRLVNGTEILIPPSRLLTPDQRLLIRELVLQNYRLKARLKQQESTPEQPPPKPFGMS